MFSTIVVLLQLTISAIIAYCLIAQMRAGSAQGTTHHKRSYTREMEQLRAMRAVRLNLPLNEAIRPAAFDQIVGQERGLRALSAILSSPNPQHIIIYGPPGVGKTCAARVALEEAKKSGASPFRKDAPFIEVDATTMRFDERAIADPLIGSVHDPIYQGAGALGVAGVPQPKPERSAKRTAASFSSTKSANCIPAQMNKLLKVLEDRRVLFESAYYDPEDPATPAYIHDIFKNGLPADFRLIGAKTVRPTACRRRCAHAAWNCTLNRAAQHLMTIAKNAAQRAGFDAQEGVAEMICAHSQADGTPPISHRSPSDLPRRRAESSCCWTMCAK
jgi:Lon-like ATP-dependent protease